MFREEDMQAAIEKRPNLFFGEGVRLYEREASLGASNRIDFILEDPNNKQFILLEVMRGYLDREHATRMWERYVPSFERMRPGARFRSVLLSNFANPQLAAECKDHGVETKIMRVEEFLKLDLPSDVFRGIRQAACDEFEGFTKGDFENLVEADRKVSTEMRLPQIGKLYQLQDYLSPHLEEMYPKTFLDAKVSNKKYPQRLGVPWMAYYFGAASEGSSGNPHINITLAEESENGRFVPTECSVHCNAELASSFRAVMKEMAGNKRVPALFDEVRKKGMELRLYSKVPLRLPSVNDNFWTFRKAFGIDQAFRVHNALEWFAQFEQENAEHLREDIERLGRTFGEKYTAFAKSHPLSAAGRCVVRLGRWWNTHEVVEQGRRFQESVLDTIRQLVPFFAVFKG